MREQLWRVKIQAKRRKMTSFSITQIQMDDFLPMKHLCKVTLLKLSLN